MSARCRKPPSRLRERPARRPADALAFALGYRPPYMWDALLEFLGARAIAGVEVRAGRRFRRALAVRHRGTLHAGWLEVSPAARKPALAVRVSASLSRVVPQVLARVRHVFDLASDPEEVARVLGPLAAGAPGLRVPGGFDGFEVGVRAIAGQQVSVRAMTTLVGRIAERFGTPLADAPEGLVRTFPGAETLAAAPAAEIAALGMPGQRARTIVALARAVADGLDLSPAADPEATLARLEAIPGIGPWTAHYVALRALGWRDAFPHTDLGVMRALGERRPAHVLARAEAWRPWRGYALIHLWRVSR